MAYSFYQRVQGIMLVFDVSDKESFESLTEWLKKIKEHANDDPEIILLGHKIDKENEIKVSEDEAQAFCE
jgi:GTPase SAR1 family protein